MGTRTVRYLLLGQATLWLSLLLSFTLLPDVVYSNQGISHFGVHAKTILPYGLGFLLCGYLTLLAAQNIPRTGDDTKRLRLALSVLALLLFAILLTPFSVNTFFDWLHMVAGTLLFGFELLLAIWLVRHHLDWLNWLLLTAQFIGSVVAAISLLHVTQLMFTGQLLAEVAFGVLLVRTVGWMLRTHV